MEATRDVVQLADRLVVLSSFIAQRAVLIELRSGFRQKAALFLKPLKLAALCRAAATVSPLSLINSAARIKYAGEIQRHSLSRRRGAV
jgi:hypothetical protein